MRARQLMPVLLSPVFAVVFAGCKSSAPPPAPSAPAPLAATAEQASVAQSEMLKVDAAARVGRVDAVNSSAGMAGVSGIPAAEVREGATLVFTDAKQTPIANGTVRSIDTTTEPGNAILIVDYKANPNSGRDPIRGDLAVFLPAAR